SYYAGNVRADKAGVNDELMRTEQFRAGTEASDDTTSLTLQSKSYFKGLVGEEKQSFSQSYKSDGKTVSSTTISYYAGNVRADKAGVNDELMRTEQFRAGTEASDDTTTLTLQSKSYFKGLVSEEKQSFSQSYKSDGKTVSS